MRWSDEGGNVRVESNRSRDKEFIEIYQHEKKKMSSEQAMHFLKLVDDGIITDATDSEILNALQAICDKQTLINGMQKIKVNAIMPRMCTQNDMLGFVSPFDRILRVNLYERPKESYVKKCNAQGKYIELERRCIGDIYSILVHEFFHKFQSDNVRKKLIDDRNYAPAKKINAWAATSCSNDELTYIGSPREYDARIASIKALEESGFRPGPLHKLQVDSIRHAKKQDALARHNRWRKSLKGRTKQLMEALLVKVIGEQQATPQKGNA